MSNFGATFRQARESKGISLDRIAADTRISTRFLRAIENEDFHSLPGGIFNRGFVRAYAEHIGLNPDQAVADYERLAEVHNPAEPVSAPREARSGRYLYPIAIAALILLVVIFYLARRGISESARSTEAQQPVPAAAAPPTAPVPVPLASAPIPPPTTAPEVTSAAPEPEPPAPAETLRIDIDVKETTWIKVAADGKTVDPGEVLEPGMTRHFTGQKSIYLSVGNAGGFSLKINDMPARAIGKSGQVREVNITTDNLQGFIG